MSVFARRYLFRELERRFAADQIVELLVLIGFYHTVSFLTNGLAIAREEAAERFPSSGGHRSV